jgi:Type II secretory pathway, component PulD
MPFRFAILFLLAALVASPLRSQTEERVSFQFPNSQVGEVANYYETLTGKTVIRDQTAVGQVTIVADNVSKEEAVALIESALLLNNFVIVDVDDRTAKLLGPSKSPKREAIPLYTDASMIPNTEQIVSYFMPLRYIKAENARTLFQQYVTVNPQYGGIEAVPNINALVITENAPLVRRVIALKDLIDVQDQQIDTEYFELQRANAEWVAEVLQKLYEPAQQSATTGAAPNAPPPSEVQPGVPVPQPETAPVSGNTGGYVAAQPPSVKVFADKRTNRVMVVAPREQMRDIARIIENLDMEVDFEEPLRRPLRFVKAADAVSVLAKLLDENSENKDSSGDIESELERLRSDNRNRNRDIGGGSDFGNSFGSSGSGLSSGSGPARLEAEDVTVKPVAIVVGNARIIADTSLNTIIVFGPPDARSKAAKVLDLLDQRPKQVYLSCVIGQLTLGDDIDFGIDYLMKFGDVRVLGQGESGTINNLIRSRNATIDLVPGTDDVVDTAAEVARTALPVISGLTVFGAIGNTVDFYARALASTNRFQIISRPMVYTMNGEVATISSGQEIPYAGSSLSNINTAGVNDIGTTVTSTTQFKKVELQLLVQPLINSSKEVTLVIAQKNDTAAGTTQVSAGTTAPTINTQQLSTKVTVPNRTTVIIGGLISDDETRVQTGIPFLKDIPGLGYIFSSTRKSKTRRELIVMIQPFIIDSETALAEANYIERANTSFKEGLFDQPVPVRPAELPTPEELQAVQQ